MPTPASQPVHLMCALVVRGAFDASIIPAFEAAGGSASIDWAPTSLIMQRIGEGARADVVLVLAEAMERLLEEGLVDAGSRRDVCRSRYGLAVRAGAPHPAIDTEESLIGSLTDARSVAFSRSGASGIYFDKLLPRLNIADAVRAKATIIPSGFTAEKLVTGEADLAVQQISELMVVPGIEVVGPFPESVQEPTTFSVAVMRGASDPVAAARLAAAITSLPDTYTASGLEPLFR